MNRKKFGLMIFDIFNHNIYLGIFQISSKSKIVMTGLITMTTFFCQKMIQRHKWFDAKISHVKKFFIEGPYLNT